MAVLGKNGDFVFNGSDLSGDGNNLGMSVAMDAIEVSTFGLSWKKFLEGIAEASLTYAAYFNGAVVIAGVPAAPTGASGAAGNVDVGNHTYAVTWANAQGETTIGATVVINVASSAKHVGLTAIGGAPPANTTKRRIYRSKAGTTTPLYYLATVNDTTSTTYDDNIADSALPTTVPPTINTSGGNDFSLFNVIGSQTTGLPFSYYPEQNVTGKVVYSGSAIMRRYQLDTRPNAVVTLAAEFVVTDTLTRAIVV